MAVRDATVDACPMTPEHRLLAELLTLAGLIAGTAEYSIMIRRRQARRDRAALQTAADTAGLQGMVRVFLADDRLV
jgi:hypothetical protein